MVAEITFIKVNLTFMALRWVESFIGQLYFYSGEKKQIYFENVTTILG